MPHHREQDVIMITGASAGVGRATAIEFAKRGARIGLMARGRERLEKARQEVASYGGEVLILPGDVTSHRDVEAAADELERTFGPITIWINNAMSTVFSEFLEIAPEDFRRVTDVTYMGYVHGTRAALSRMRKSDHGVIVQVGSALAYRGIPLQSAYCGAKHAIQGFTESVRCELQHQKSRIHVTMVQLPAINTPQFDWCKNNLDKKSKPVPPIFQPEVAAKAIVWSAYHRRREINVGGNVILLLWGNRFVPALGDWYLGKTGYRSQMLEEPEEHDRPFNLWKPVAGDYGSRGKFNREAKTKSRATWLSMHPALTLSIIFLIAAWWIYQW